MVDEDLGEATLVYEGPDGETVEEHVENEHLAYFQDHWIVKTDGGNGGGTPAGGDESDDDGSAADESDVGEPGPDTVRRIPAYRVYYVEREVDEFEAEVSSVVDDVQSVASGLERELRTVTDRLQSAAGDVQGGLLGGNRGREDEDEVHRIQVETGEAVTGEPEDSDEE